MFDQGKFTSLPGKLISLPPRCGTSVGVRGVNSGGTEGVGASEGMLGGGTSAGPGEGTICRCAKARARRAGMLHVRGALTLAWTRLGS